MNELAAELPAAGVVRVIGPEDAAAGFLVSASGLIVTYRIIRPARTQVDTAP